MSTSVGNMMLAGSPKPMVEHRAKPVVEQRFEQAGFARGVIIACALSIPVWLIVGYFVFR